MKLLKRLAFAVVLALSLAALGSSIVFAQETDDPVKIEIYKRFVDNRLQNPVAAYQAARDYLTKYNKDKDQYTDYLSKWMAAYERDERKRNLPIFINAFGGWLNYPEYFFFWNIHGQNAIFNDSSYQSAEMDKLIDAARHVEN